MAHRWHLESGRVACGHKTVADDVLEIKAMTSLFERNPFHIVRRSFHDPRGKVEPFCHRSLIRKPDYGMLVCIEGEAFHNGVIVDWDKSLFVGDRPDDENCAKNAGIRFEWAHTFFNRAPYVPSKVS